MTIPARYEPPKRSTGQLPTLEVSFRCRSSLLFRNARTFLWAVLLSILGAGVSFAEPTGDTVAAAEACHCDWTALASRDTMDLYLHDQLVGDLLHSIEVDSLGGGILQRTVISVSGGASAAGASAMDLTETYRYDLQGRIVSASLVLLSPSGRSDWELLKQNDTAWVFRVTAGGTARERVVTGIADNVNTECRLRCAVREGTAKVGDRWSDTVFNLMAGNSVPVITECVNVPSDTSRGGYWRFVNRDDLLGRQELLEIDGEGRTVLQEIAPLFVARRRLNNGHTLGSRHVSHGPLTDLFLVPKPPPGDSLVRVRIADGVTLDSALLHRFYTADGDGIVLNALPDTCLFGDVGKGLLQYLEPTVTMQVDNPEIRGLAAKLKGKETDACDIVARFTRYVYQTIEKRNVATFSSALETLHAGFGDCGEHAVLLAALLRAAGVPTRVVLGLVYVPSKRGYLYHAWVMAFPGQSWVFADPAMGRFPASDGLVPLIFDDTGEHSVFLGKLVGRVAIEYSAPRKSAGRH